VKTRINHPSQFLVRARDHHRLIHPQGLDLLGGARRHALGFDLGDIQIKSGLAIRKRDFTRDGYGSFLGFDLQLDRTVEVRVITEQLGDATAEVRTGALPSARPELGKDRGGPERKDSG